MKETLEVNDRSTRNYFTSSHTSHQYSPRSWRLKKKTRKVRFKKCATWTSTDCLSGSLNIYCSFGRIKVLPYALVASTNRGVRYIVIRFFAPIIIRPPELSLFRTSDRSTIVNNEVCRALPAMKQGCLRRRETWYIISFMNQKSLGIHTHTRWTTDTRVTARWTCLTASHAKTWAHGMKTTWWRRRLLF